MAATISPPYECRNHRHLAPKAKKSSKLPDAAVLPLIDAELADDPEARPTVERVWLFTLVDGDWVLSEVPDCLFPKPCSRTPCSPSAWLS